MRAFLIFWIAGLIFSLFVPTETHAQTLNCRIIDTTTESCSGIYEALVFRMSSLSDAHAELPDKTTYRYAICCRVQDDQLRVDVNPANCDQGKVASLSSETNAHVESYDFSIYPYKLCLSATMGGKILCAYRGLSCKAGETCLASASSMTNAHVGECSAYSNYKICCVYIPPRVKVEPTIPHKDEKLKVYVGGESRVILKVTNPSSNDRHAILVLDSNTPEIASTSYFSNHKHDKFKNRMEVYLRPYQSVYIPITVFGVKPGTYEDMDGIYIHDGTGAQGIYTNISLEILAPSGAESAYISAPDFGWLWMVLTALIASLLVGLM